MVLLVAWSQSGAMVGVVIGGIAAVVLVVFWRVNQAQTILQRQQQHNQRLKEAGTVLAQAGSIALLADPLRLMNGGDGTTTPALDTSVKVTVETAGNLIAGKHHLLTGRTDTIDARQIYLIVEARDWHKLYRYPPQYMAAATSFAIAIRAAVAKLPGRETKSVDAQPKPQSETRVERLATLARLLESGALTEGEFAAEKARLLGTPDLSILVCPRCGSDAGEGDYCSSCGLRLADELPTRARWEQNQADGMADPAVRIDLETNAEAEPSRPSAEVKNDLSLPPPVAPAALPPGWYAEPGTGRQRYWDGSDWWEQNQADGMADPAMRVDLETNAEAEPSRPSAEVKH